MANISIILGKSGTGKSTSIKNLDPKTTVIVNTLGKHLPFKGSKSVYNATNKNLVQLEDYTQIIAFLQMCDKQSHIKNIIIDDAIYTMRKEYFKRAKENGFNKFVELAQHFQQIIQTCETMREEINVFLIMHSEDVVSDSTIAEYKVATIGRMLDEKYNPIEVVPIVLYSDVKFNNDGTATYGFYTHRTKVGNTTIPAKTPDGMFDKDFIPNDLALVVKAMEEYYN